jgi:signal peptidase I
MKKLFYGVLIGIVLLIAVISVNTKSNGTPILTYVYSNSMSPLIKVNDAFLALPVATPRVGDIIVFRPTVLKAPYITHRIIGVGDIGFITKGDNSPYKDQDSGEPEVTPDRIVGRVVSINGQPLIIPGLGKLTARFQARLGANTRYLSAAFLFLGVVATFLGKNRKNKPRLKNRWRLRHVYRTVVIIAACSIIISIYIGSRVSQITYLVSEYPGSQGDQIKVNQPDQLKMKVINNAIFPVWTIITGIAPLSVNKAPEYLWIRSEDMVLIDVEPHRQIGLYQGYVQIYYYPILLPRTWLFHLHRESPVFAILATGFTMAFWSHLLLKLLNHIHGLEAWIPLRAIKDKLLRRRIKRTRAKLIGRRKPR